MLAAKLFRITSQKRQDTGKAEDLTGLPTGLWLCGKACEYSENFPGNNKTFSMTYKARV